VTKQSHFESSTGICVASRVGGGAASAAAAHRYGEVETERKRSVDAREIGRGL
jgi:hypothetical protein